MGRIEELEFLNRALDDFVNVVSHDFKTLVTSISLLTHLALKTNFSEKAEGFPHQIKRNSNKLKARLKDLTKLVDIKKSRFEKVDIVNLKHALDVILSEYNHSLEEIGGKLIAKFFMHPKYDILQPTLSVCLANLISNALKYRRPDTPWLSKFVAKEKRTTSY